MWAVGVEEERKRRKQMERCEEARTDGNQAPGLDSGFSGPYRTVCSESSPSSNDTFGYVPASTRGWNRPAQLSHYFLPLLTGHSPEGLV